MINGLAALLVGQLLGEILVRALGLPIPGPVLGLVLLAAYLSLVGFGRDDVEATANGILRHLALLFVPASTGIVQHLGILSDHAIAIGFALVTSTILTLIVTVLVFRLVERLFGDPEEEAPE
ncbi:MAG: CidA/LrgA family protein [Pseudomonadota bacterium]